MEEGEEEEEGSSREGGKNGGRASSGREASVKLNRSHSAGGGPGVGSRVGGRGRQPQPPPAAVMGRDVRSVRQRQRAPEFAWRFDRRLIQSRCERWRAAAGALSLLALAATVAQTEVLFQTGGVDGDYGPLGPVLDIRGRSERVG